MTGALQRRLQLLDWRRRVAELYAAVRAEADPERGWAIWREGRRQLFLAHPSSPLPGPQRSAAYAPAYFDYDPAYRVVAAVDEVPGETVAVPWSTGGGDPVIRAGHARFALHGDPCSLELYWLDDYAGGLLVMCRDATSGSETYGAGRYLLDTAKGADLGEAGSGIVLDFNYAYQPSCSYDPQWSCPLPPPANRLPQPVRAGERLATA